LPQAGAGLFVAAVTPEESAQPLAAGPGRSGEDQVGDERARPPAPDAVGSSAVVDRERAEEADTQDC